MGINAAKNIIISKVAPSVRLKGVKGTEQQRAQLSNELNNKFFESVEDIFEQKIKTNKEPMLDDSELLDCIKKAVPGVKVKLKPEPRDIAAGSIELLLDKTKKTVIALALRMHGNVKKGVNDDILRHEMRHLFDYVTQPKLVARTNSDALIGRLKNYDKEADLFHFQFYDDVLYSRIKKQDELKEISAMTKDIKEHFRDLQTPQNERIEILQNWRSYLKTEKNAYGDEAGYMCKENPKKYLEENYGDFFFEGKIKLVEKMLKDEIAAVRKRSLVKYGN